MTVEALFEGFCSILTAKESARASNDAHGLYGLLEIELEAAAEIMQRLLKQRESY
jgi:hypothetical protein